MKEWIQENTYIACLIGIIAGIGLVFGFLIYKSSASGSEGKSELNKTHTSIQKLRAELGSPSEKAATQLKKNINEGIGLSVKLYDDLAASGRHELNYTKSTTDFNTILGNYISSNKEALKAAEVKFPSNTMFGFEKYSEGLIVDNSEAIALCLYQQDAFTWLLGILQKLGPSELVSMNRKTLKEEGEKLTVKPKEVPTARTMRFDLSVKVSEEQLAQLMKEIVNSDEHLMVVRYLSLKNEKSSPIPEPSIMNDEVKETTPADPFNFGTFGGGEGGEDVTAPADAEPVSEGRDASEPVKPGDKVLEQILGNEKLHVGLVIDLVLISEFEELSIKKGK